jgi:hypothetical protein
MGYYVRMSLRPQEAHGVSGEINEVVELLPELVTIAAALNP